MDRLRNIKRTEITSQTNIRYTSDDYGSGRGNHWYDMDEDDKITKYYGSCSGKWDTRGDHSGSWRCAGNGSGAV